MALGKIQINDREYDDLPLRIEPVLEGFGVAATSHKLLGNRRVVGVESAADVDDYSHYRRIKAQAWVITWDGAIGMMEEDLKSYLKHLYETQQGFWIRLDDEMSRDYAKLVVANPDFSDPTKPKAYFTPTYPIVPYGYETGDDISWNNPHDLIIETTYADSVEYTVDAESGLVLLPPMPYAFKNNTRIYFRYGWRAFVRLARFEYAPKELAQNAYLATALIEQLPLP